MASHTFIKCEKPLNRRIVKLGVMAMKRYSILPTSFELEPHQ